MSIKTKTHSRRDCNRVESGAGQWSYEVNIIPHPGAVNPKLTSDQRFRLLIDASPDAISAVDSVLVNGAASILKSPSPSVRLLTITDAAKRTGLSRPTIYKLIASGKLQAKDVGLSSPRIREADLAALAEGGAV